MRLIDADKLLKRVDEEREYLKARGQLGAEHILVHNFRDLIDNAPTVITDSLYEAYCKMNDEEFELTESFTVKTPKGKIVKFVKERPQGEWYYNYQNGWHCSICRENVKDMPTIMGKADFNFCPNCGASMTKGSAENER